jgi:hypothetical protein
VKNSLCVHFNLLYQQRMIKQAKRAHLRSPRSNRHVSGSQKYQLDFTCSILIRWRWKLHLSGRRAPYWLTVKQTEQFQASRDTGQSEALPFRPPSRPAQNRKLELGRRQCPVQGASASSGRSVVAVVSKLAW